MEFQSVLPSRNFAFYELLGTKRPEPFNQIQPFWNSSSYYEGTKTVEIVVGEHISFGSDAL